MERGASSINIWYSTDKNSILVIKIFRGCADYIFFLCIPYIFIIFRKILRGGIHNFLLPFKILGLLKPIFLGLGAKTQGLRSFKPI